LLLLTVEDTANVSTPFNTSASTDASLQPIPGTVRENRFTTLQSLGWMYNGATPEIKIEIPA
jgi:hypothetical protein